MSGFKALNIESDDESEVEIDDTKEVQIEEALKLYQNALKYHAEGPASFDKAAHAYQELFDSEIFTYPESQPELRRVELYDPASENDEIWDGIAAEAVAPSGGMDTGPSTLPQILHLSHKNYAQFKLEYLNSQLDTLDVTLTQILANALTVLDHFVQALDKDDSDLDLWRRTAVVGELVNSKRVARFCLEAVMDDDGEGLSSVVSLPGLEGCLAAEQLRKHVSQLDDQLSLLQASLSVGKRRVLSRMLKQRLNIYDGIMARAETLRAEEDWLGAQIQQPQRLVLRAPSTWAEMGETILRQLLAEQHGTSTTAPAIAISFDLSNASPSAAQAYGAADLPLGAEQSTKPVALMETRWPIGIDAQFPGLDHGDPTAQPQIAPADASMRHEIADDIAIRESPTMTLPSRKRSGDAAGLQDSTEEGRTKSRRIRARDSNADSIDNRQALIDAAMRWEFEQQLNEFQAADDWMFETVSNLFERIGVVRFDAAKDVRQELQALTSTSTAMLDDSCSSPKDNFRKARADIHAFLHNYNDQIAYVLIQSPEALGVGQAQNITGVGGSLANGTGSKVTSKPMFSEDGLLYLLAYADSNWLPTEEVAWLWLCRMLNPNQSPAPAGENSYTRDLWPDALKTMVVRTLVNFDDSFHERASGLIEQVRFPWKPHAIGALCQLTGMVQSIFELHLDIYTLIKAPNSGVDAETVTLQGDRLQRWSNLASELVHLRCVSQGTLDLKDETNLRCLWATTFSISAASDVTQDHVIECMSDLRVIFVSAGEPTIYLQNNAVMPELSTAALDREISRLTTKDFFLKITSQDLGGPVAVIESLEPLLESLDRSICSHNGGPEITDQQPSEAPPSLSQEVIRFLRNSDTSVRLLLWQRLGDAYLAIDYRPMVISCYLRMMRMMLDELQSNALSGLSQSERQIGILKTLRLLQDMTSKTVIILRSTENALECIDETGLKLAISMFGELLQLLQVFNVFEDSLRVGQSQRPILPNGLPVPSFAAANAMLHDMQLHIWIILYELLKEAIYHNSYLFPTPAEDQFDFLRCVHRNLGIRGICGGSNRAFVRLLKEEFLHMTHVEGYDSEQAQVLYDLYGLNCFLNPAYELIEHHCTHDAFLDRGVAAQATDLLVQQASKLPVKELVKHSLKDTIDKVHGAVPRRKPTEAILRNRELYRAFTRSPINPLDLFNCLKGEGNDLAVSTVPTDDAVLASKGWYFLMGHIALTKFRSQKRTAPTPTEDVDIAIAFFMQDLEYNMDNWETWFRLAQAYDTKIEECVVWSAEKLNNNMSEIVQQQRIAIHSYALATALAYRYADLAFATSDKMTELYHDFAMRLYSSSREPFRMLAFATEDAEKFISMGNGIGKSKPFAPLRLFTAWKLAKVLFQRALAGKPRSWYLHFMLGKCLWKMHCASDALREHDQPPSAQQVLDAFIRAVELLPNRKDSRERREPTLEPHYKLVSIVHKMISRRDITLEQAQEALGNTTYARAVTFPQELDEWVPYVLTVLKNLRNADKSNWHHRMIARAAQIIYHDSDTRADGGPSGNNLGAMGAKHELTQQMFTKTMVLQVWRPECERAGRHFVYTARYTRFFVRILEQLKDRANLEQLARRVRRRPHDVFEHGLVWQDICNAYLRLLRGYAALPEGLETSTFSNIAHEEFLVRKEPLERWMQAQDSGISAALDVLREVQELKKVNQSLMKPGPIDDLIGDSYAYLFSTIGRQLWEDERRVKQEEEARRPLLPVASPPRNPMMSLNHLMNLDGAQEIANLQAPAPASSSTAVAGVATTPAEQFSPRKKIGVGRREIRTCAESCFQKAAAAVVKPNGPFNTRVQVVIDNSRNDLSGNTSAATSAPGSIHDSADDESELSELEEEDGDRDEAEREEDGEVRGLIFPGLANAGESREVSLGTTTLEESVDTEVMASKGQTDNDVSITSNEATYG